MQTSKVQYLVLRPGSTEKGKYLKENRPCSSKLDNLDCSFTMKVANYPYLLLYIANLGFFPANPCAHNLSKCNFYFYMYKV